MEHTLKTLAPYWDAIASGEKNFEVRRDDRGFQKGDTLVLQRLQPNGYLLDYASFELGAEPKQIRKRVTYILTGGQLGIEPGHVVMGLIDEPAP